VRYLIDKKASYRWRDLKVKRSSFFVIILLLIISLVSTGCSAMEVSPGSAPTPTPMPAPRPTEEKYMDEGYSYTDDSTSNVLSDGDIERRIVRSGRMTLQVEDVVEAINKIEDVATLMGGYVVSSYKYEEEEEIVGEISIRIPSNKFDEGFDRLRQIAQDVPYEHTDSTDITEEYIDLEARLHNLEATEDQYLELLNRAETVDEMLQVQRELSNVRGYIEQLQGRMKYLERVSDMALIEISLRGAGSIAGPWSLVNTLKTAAHGVITFVRGLITVLIWIGIFCWVWIPILVILIRRRRKSRNSGS
jgi:hypothetical protein